MIKKINRINIAIISISLILVITISSLVNYKIEKAHELKWIKSNLLYLSTIKREANDFSEYQKFKNTASSIRLTVIDLNGKVIFDSDGDVKKMKNHANRIEIKKANAGEIASAQRHSKTLDVDTIYIAKKTINGDVLRLSTQLTNIYGTVKRILLWDLLVFIIAIVISVYATIKVTKKIFKPILFYGSHLDKILFDDIEYDVEIYKELLPFVYYLKEQKAQINKHIKSIEDKKFVIQNILENMNEGLLTIDHEDKIILYNNSAKNLLAVDYDIDYKGKDLKYFIRDENDYNRIIKLIRQNKNDSIELSNEEKTLKIYITNNNDGTSLLVIIDISFEKNAADMRRQFSSNVSHELKGPLTSIMGYSEMIYNQLTPEEDTIKFSGVILEKSKRMLKLIDDIINLSQLDEGTFDKSEQEFDLSQMIFSIEKSLDSNIKKKNIEFGNKFENEFIVSQNIQFVERVLENIISNAVKYNKEDGKVSISLEKDEDYSFVVEVHDTGIGIKQAHINRIFERFYIVDKARTAENNSTGLGLAIVKSLMKIFDGKVEIDSIFGEYTKVRLWFK